MRTVVVGASSGLGRSIAIGLTQRGAQVAMLARRRDRLDAAGDEAGAGALAIACDVTDEESCRSAIDDAATGLGGIDALVYAPAIGPLARLVDVDAETWRRVFDTNVIGAARITAAAVPHLDGDVRHGRLPVVGERVAHTAVARARRLHREQGRPRQARRGVARRAPRHRVHAPRRRRLRRWRGRLAVGVQRGLGSGAGRGARTRLVHARPHQRLPDRSRGAHHGGRRACCAAAPACRCRR